MTGERRLPPLPLLVAATAIGPFSLHILIPAMPGLVAAFGTDYATIQLTLTLYLVGISAAQMVYGPLSDRFGRRPVLIGGLSLYLAATAFCLFAASITVLIAGRVLQAVGGCAGMVVGRAIIRDVQGQDRAASTIGYVTMVMTIGSSLAPCVGGYLDHALTWRGIFAFLAVGGIAVVGFAYGFLPETNRQPQSRIDGSSIWRHFGQLIRSRVFLGYAGHTAFNMAGWYAFLAAAPYVMVKIFDRPQTDYGLYIILVMAGYIVGNYIAGRWSVRFGGYHMIVAGILISMVSTAMLLALTVAGMLTPILLFASMSLIILGSGISMPSANAGAISVNPRIAGAASGVLGFLQMTISAIGTLLVGYLHDGTELPMVVVIVGAMTVSAAALILIGRPPVKSIAF